MSVPSQVIAPQDSQRAVYAERQAAWDALIDRLLAVGGEQVVMPLSAEDDLDKLISGRGRHFNGDMVESVAGRRSACHANSAALYEAGEGEIATGYALSKDGLWRQHSWLLRPDGTLIETTEPRAAYYGITLDATEADEFCFWQ